MNRSASTSMTSADLSRRPTRIAKHSRLNSSTTLSMRSLRPSARRWVIRRRSAWIRDRNSFPATSTWAYANGVMLDFSRAGKPTTNAYIEAVNGRFRAECRNTHWFLTVADAPEQMEAWHRYHIDERPHGAFEDKVPCELQNPAGATSPPP
jgi:transposase InsO family protein